MQIFRRSEQGCFTRGSSRNCSSLLSSATGPAVAPVRRSVFSAQSCLGLGEGPEPALETEALGAVGKLRTMERTGSSDFHAVRLLG